MTTSGMAGFIIAGGESRRMGRDKALLELGGVPLILRAARLLEAVTGPPTVIGEAEAFRPLGLQAIGDAWPGSGPLGAIATALAASRSEWNLIIACDLPYLTTEWLAHLVRRALESHADAVLPMNTAGAEPLCAAYRRHAAGAIREALSHGVRKVTDGLATLHIEWIRPEEWKAFDSEGLLFKNMNLPGDYEEAKARLAGRAAQ